MLSRLAPFDPSDLALVEAFNRRAEPEPFTLPPYFDEPKAPVFLELVFKGDYGELALTKELPTEYRAPRHIALSGAILRGMRDPERENLKNLWKSTKCITARLSDCPDAPLDILPGYIFERALRWFEFNANTVESLGLDNSHRAEYQSLLKLLDDLLQLHLSSDLFMLGTGVPNKEASELILKSNLRVSRTLFLMRTAIDWAAASDKKCNVQQVIYPQLLVDILRYSRLDEHYGFRFW